MTLKNMNDFTLAPFPEDIPIAELEQISLNKLVILDDVEIQRLLDICTTSGFFYLNCTDHPQGLKLHEQACAAARVGKEVFPNLSHAEKSTYKQRPRLGVFDMGYFTLNVDEDGDPIFSETINIPQTELFAQEPTDFKLPSWLAQHEELFKEAMKTGNDVTNIVFGALERGMKLKPGRITSLHKLTEPSSDFLRLLRYMGQKEGRVDQLAFPAHTDAISLAILFSWLGGLQIIQPGAKMLSKTVPEKESDWRWIKPLDGHAVVNLGDAMEVLSNKTLKSGVHRVVRPPGEQKPFQKYTVLFGARPANTALMTPFESPLVPKLDLGADQLMTSEEWGTARIAWLKNALKERQEKGEVLIKA